jgi:hypothetical protein
MTVRKLTQGRATLVSPRKQTRLLRRFRLQPASQFTDLITYFILIFHRRHLATEGVKVVNGLSVNTRTKSMEKIYNL